MQVITKALQLHPREAGLWSYAAAWEFGDNRNAAGARSLMQQGLRYPPFHFGHSQALLSTVLVNVTALVQGH